MENEKHRPQIQTLACPYTNCYLYSRKGVGNLTVRKLYGKDQIRYLRCCACAQEFSERKKNTALFNSKIEEKKAISVAEHLAEGNSMKATSRLVGVSAEAVRRLRRNLRDYSRDFHDERVEDIEATSVQMDERYGYVRSKKEPLWEATAIEPKSRLLYCRRCSPWRSGLTKGSQGRGEYLRNEDVRGVSSGQRERRGYAP